MERDRELELAREIGRILPHITRQPIPPKQPQKIETSKKLMWFSVCLAAWTALVLTISWFTGREAPAELIRFTTWFCSTVGFGYLCKSGYENREKIKNGRNGGDM